MTNQEIAQTITIDLLDHLASYHVTSLTTKSGLLKVGKEFAVYHKSTYDVIYNGIRNKSEPNK